MGNCQQSTVVDDTFSVPVADFSIPVRTTRRMGWKRDLPDFRDRVLVLPAAATKNLPKKKDLRPQEHFGVYDQGHLGSCTANAIGAGYHFCMILQGTKEFTPSRLFIYFNERSMEGTVGEDSGAYIRDGIKSVHKIGVCSETLWPYAEDKFTVKPSPPCYEQAVKNTCKEYAQVTQTLESLKACINEGYPFVFGFVVLASFMTQQVAATGKMVLPQAGDYVLGGHAVMGIGFDDDLGCFIIRNSWGTGWGQDGYFFMPYEYICHQQLASDFWMMRVVDGPALQTKPAGPPLEK